MPLLGLGIALAACSGGGGSGGSSAPIQTPQTPPELALCRAQADRVFRATDTLLRTAQNLGTDEIPSRAGAESGLRISPDGTWVVFARERTSDRPESRELVIAPVANTEVEQRLTVNAHLDDSPCWSPDGTQVLFSSEGSGERRLWITPIASPQPREFLAGTTPDTEPDWHGATDRIAFSRFDSGLGRWRVMLANGDGTGVTPLTDGGIAAGDPGDGDHQPAFHPDGRSLAFVRGTLDPTGAGRAHLWVVDIGSGTARAVIQGARDVRLPRWAPAGDRLFLAIAEPEAGRPGHRLSEVRVSSTGPLVLDTPVLVDPDKRFGYPGIDVFPDMPAAPAADPQLQPVTFGDRSVVIYGLIGPTDLDFLRAQDSTPLIVATTTTSQREVAGVNINTAIPDGIAATDILEVRVRAVVAVRRIGGDTIVRLGLRDHIERRGDTVVELQPTGTGYMELSFATSSLAHVDRNGFISAEVIADVEPGARTEFWVDLVEIQIAVRAP